MADLEIEWDMIWSLPGTTLPGESIGIVGINYQPQIEQWKKGPWLFGLYKGMKNYSVYIETNPITHL